MQKFEVDKIEDLSDVFYAVIGGRPDNIEEIKEFIQRSPLQQLMYTSDVERILEFDGYFAEETVDAVYALLPVKIPLGENRNWIMTPNSFEKLNRRKIALPASRIVNISFTKAQEVYNARFTKKVQKVMEKIAEVRQRREEREHLEREREAQKQKELEIRVRQYDEWKKQEQERLQREKMLREQQLKEQQERELREKQEAQRKAEEKALKEAQKREKARLRMQKYRAEHPEKRKSYYKPLDTLPARKRRRQRKANNKRNAVYRAKNKEQIRERHNARRAKMKAENPELLKELDRKHNMTRNRKEAGQRYYQKHKEEINQKARQNPMVKVYKRRYQIKKRLKKTGPVISALLQGLIAAKER